MFKVIKKLNRLQDIIQKINSLQTTTGKTLKQNLKTFVLSFYFD